MAVDASDALFQSRIDEQSRKKARNELHELNDKDRELAVQSLRQWALQQKWLRTPTEFEFLLRFLRARKFSQLEARKTLENYWTIKTKTPEWFRDVDPADPIIQEILRTGVYTVPKNRDSQGRRYFIERLGKLDLNLLQKKWGVDNLFKTLGLVCDWLNRDENIQVNGVVGFADCSDLTLSHVMAIWTMDNGKRLLNFYQKSLPARFKGTNIYNEPTFFDAMYALFMPFLSQKTKDRIRLHGRSMVSVYKHVDPHLLPDEYLPDDFDGKSVGSIDSLVEEMIADMNTPEFRRYIRNLSSDKYGVDLKARGKDKGKNQDVPVASFRKLNVD